MASTDPLPQSRFPRCCHVGLLTSLEFHRYSALHCADYYSPRRLLCLKADALSSELREQGGNCTRLIWLRQAAPVCVSVKVLRALGTHRFQRAVSAKDLLIGIRRPRTGGDAGSGSYKFAFC